MVVRCHQRSHQWQPEVSPEVITVVISGHHRVGRSIAYALTLRVILLEIAPPPAGVERERPARSVSMQGLSWYLMREAISVHQRQSEAITNQKVSMHYAVYLSAAKKDAS